MRVDAENCFVCLSACSLFFLWCATSAQCQNSFTCGPFTYEVHASLSCENHPLQQFFFALASPAPCRSFHTRTWIACRIQTLRKWRLSGRERPQSPLRTIESKTSPPREAARAHARALQWAFSVGVLLHERLPLKRPAWPSQMLVKACQEQEHEGNKLCGVPTGVLRGRLLLIWYPTACNFELPPEM